jgi:hypothetical protein
MTKSELADDATTELSYHISKEDVKNFYLFSNNRFKKKNVFSIQNQRVKYIFMLKSMKS